MRNIDDTAFALVQEIDDQNPGIARENLIDIVTNALVQRNYTKPESHRAAIMQVAEYEHQNSFYSVDISLSTSRVIFVRIPNQEQPRAIFLNDIINNHLHTDAA